MQTYQRTDLIDEAIQAVAASVDSMRDTYEAELGTIEAELAGINAKIDNLLNAIENGLSQDDTVERITGHRQRANQLHERRHELTDLITSSPTGPTQDQLAGIIASIHGAIEQADSNAIKRLFESIVHEVRVTGRNSIRPYFRIPANETTPDLRSGVRTLTGSVPPAGYNPKLLPTGATSHSG
jgi:hypothetical protein